MNKLAKYDQELTFETRLLKQAMKISDAVQGLANIKATVLHDVSENGNHRWLIQFNGLEIDQYYYIMGICDAIIHA